MKHGTKPLKFIHQILVVLIIKDMLNSTLTVMIFLMYHESIPDKLVLALAQNILNKLLWDSVILV